MAEEDKWGLAENSWYRRFNTAALHGHSEHGDAADRSVTAMDDEDDDGRHSEDGHGSSE